MVAPSESVNNGPRWSIENIASAVAPATLVTVLLVHVSYTRGRSYYGYFGVSQGILNIPVETYLMRSADATFGVAVWLAAAALCLIALDRLLEALRGKAPLIGRRTTWAVILAGGGIAFSSLAFALFQPSTGILPSVFAAALAFGSAVSLRCALAIGKSSGKLRSSYRPWVALLACTVILGSFWAATLYAQRLGQAAAAAVDEAPERLPLATVFAPEYLDIAGTYVQVTHVGQGDTSSWRYTGLRLLTYSDGQWFLLTGRYGSAYRSTVAVMRNGDAVRVEIAAPDVPAAAAVSG
jgi:hypothetical protein